MINIRSQYAVVKIKPNNMIENITFTNEAGETIDIDITNASNKNEIYRKVKLLPNHKNMGNDFGGIKVHFHGGGNIEKEQFK